MAPEELLSAQRVMIVAAHPDDEVIGAGGLFEQFGRGLRIVFVTNGATESYPEREAYSAARYAESMTAAAVAGIRSDQFRLLSFSDQRVAHNLPAVAASLARELDEFRPNVILTHPYEGGHPDHDATAFGVHAAAQCPVWEFASYHAGPGGSWETGVFLPGSDHRIFDNILAPRPRVIKEQMFAIFETQRDVLKQFRTDVERYRPAPRYNFIEPPHAGQLLYEQFEWGMTGRRFCELAAAALEGMHVTHNS